MCRFLLYNSQEPHHVSSLLADFANMCKASKNFQGDGWGLIYREGSELVLRRSLNPIWEEASRVELPPTDFLLVHARWAHGDWTKGNPANNQPYHKDGKLFVFNGNLKRVRGLDVPGRIGAEKIFNLVLQDGPERAVRRMKESAQLIKAINFLLIQESECLAHSYFPIDPDYFDLRLWEGNGEWMISSYPLPGKEFSRLPKGQVTRKALYQNISGYSIAEKPFNF